MAKKWSNGKTVEKITSQVFLTPNSLISYYSSLMNMFLAPACSSLELVSNQSFKYSPPPLRHEMSKVHFKVSNPSSYNLTPNSLPFLNPWNSSCSWKRVGLFELSPKVQIVYQKQIQCRKGCCFLFLFIGIKTTVHHQCFHLNNNPWKSHLFKSNKKKEWDWTKKSFNIIKNTTINNFTRPHKPSNLYK